MGKEFGRHREAPLVASPLVVLFTPDEVNSFGDGVPVIARSFLCPDRVAHIRQIVRSNKYVAATKFGLRVFPHFSRHEAAATAGLLHVAQVLPPKQAANVGFIEDKPLRSCARFGRIQQRGVPAFLVLYGLSTEDLIDEVGQARLA